MKKPTLLLAVLALLAAPAAAQDTPPTRPTDGKGNWLMYDQPPKPARPYNPALDEPQVGRGTKTTMGTTYVPLDNDIYRLIDRYAILQGSDSLGDIHTSVRPYTRAAVAQLAERMLADSSAGLSAQDRFNVRYLLRDNWHDTRLDSATNARSNPYLGFLYQRHSDLYSVETPDFSLRVNPVAGLSLGNNDGAKNYAFLNTRGVQIEGTVDQRLGFYAFLADNQMAVPFYVQERIERDRAVPHEGFWKPFKTTPGQYDFLSARGYVSYAAGRHVSLQLGHDRNQIGNGYRSLILSDYSSPYLFFKIQTRVWKFKYQNLFAQLITDPSDRDDVYDRKFLALHHLSLDVLPNLNIGVFESVISGSRSRDTVLVRGVPQYKHRNTLELQYLNPVIFYRSIEQNVGSADGNALFGIDFKWNIKKQVQLYGQLVLDEFRLNDIRAGNGSWTNKQAVQLGAKYLNVAGIRNFDLQGEFNFIRPFTYQARDKYADYQHAAQPLAHPMGANLWELIGIASYQPLPRLHVVGKGFFVKQGLDPVGQNYGSNVLLPYTTRPAEEGFFVGSGITSYLLHTDLTASYQAAHNLFIDGKLVYRHRTFSGNEPVPAYYTADGGALASIALRWNIAQRLHEF
ncbi:hypothetical protein [Hymenobacter psychrophilus]|uniref:Capsule assembly protein Wzi n=1 Tax=Hymenobacter psychrophilus TaxID=651662 RepID=A0A1H3NS69_9BACT|nr:hypothetical protein [Hymenobacter psychrophilus]SDY91029.1 hypothetical protein SAMN04488069_11836 [Hymenobacter psychrophilus]